MQIETAKIVVRLCVLSTCEFCLSPQDIYIFVFRFCLLSRAGRVRAFTDCTISPRAEREQDKSTTSPEMSLSFDLHIFHRLPMCTFLIYLFSSNCRVCVLCVREMMSNIFNIRIAFSVHSLAVLMLISDAATLSLLLVDFSIFIIICIYITAASRHCTRQTAQRAEL